MISAARKIVEWMEQRRRRRRRKKHQIEFEISESEYLQATLGWMGRRNMIKSKTLMAGTQMRQWAWGARFSPSFNNWWVSLPLCRSLKAPEKNVNWKLSFRSLKFLLIDVLRKKTSIMLTTRCMIDKLTENLFSCFGKVRIDSAAMGCECDATWLYWINITVFWLCRARNTFSPNHTSAETFFSAVFKCQNSLASSLFWKLDLWPRTNQRTLGYRKRGKRCRVAN